jgi:MazG family protein
MTKLLAAPFVIRHSSFPMSNPAPPDPRLPGIDQLLELMATLRGPEGCPWDREQTHASLRAGLIEEAYEVAAAIDASDDANLREELGDLLLQVVFHAQLAREQGRFDFDAVVRGIVEKLVRRHPHVFGADRCADAGAVLARWEEIKRGEKGGGVESALEGVPAGLPALLRAHQVQKKAAKVGFDWPDAAPIFDKVREELAEAEAARADPARLEDELGDVLFSVVNLARHLRVDAEPALHRATEKFARRFRAVEALARDRGFALEGLPLAQLDSLWDEVKAQGG